MKIKTLLLAGAAFAATTTAQAIVATPTLSGPYLFSITTFCQAVVNPWPNGTTTLIQGDYVVDTGIGKFDASTNTFSFSGTNIVGSVIAPNTNGGQLKTTKSKITDQPYSNTATTITLGTEQSQVVYGSVKAGIAQQFDTFSTSTQNSTPAPTAPNCISHVTASHI
ncbi:MAG TPA: hypothetical protein VIJ62_02385 [Rhizomicrobium sp.]